MGGRLAGAPAGSAPPARPPHPPTHSHHSADAPDSVEQWRRSSEVSWRQWAPTLAAMASALQRGERAGEPR